MQPATNSLERALALLELLEQTPGGLTNAEISRHLGIPKSTCSYIMTRLERKGYLLRDPNSGRCQIGLTTVALAHGALREIGVRSIAEPALYRLASETGLSAGIGVLERGRVLVIDRVEGSDFVREAVETAHALSRTHRRREDRDIGRELPAHSTALGKVLLAHLPRRQVLALVREQGLKRQSRTTITSRAGLLRELDLVRKQGYAISDREQSATVRAIAAPIYSAAGVVSAAVSLNGSMADTAWSDPGGLVERVKAAAREISRRARFQPAIDNRD
jgi:DNA-binding IclR family transcriptional regulator